MVPVFSNGSRGTFNDETFFLIRLSKSIYKFGYRFIGQHIGYRLSNIKNYRVSVSAKIFIMVHPYFIIKHVTQFSNSKDGILQQSPIELILTLSLGFREERTCNAVKGKKKRGYNT